MSFYRRIKYFLVHTLFISNKEAQTLIDDGRVEINGISISENCLIDAASEIKVNGNVVRAKTEYAYLLFNKPVGCESTLNPQINGNLSSFFSNYTNLAIAGRLDKQSEGLLILSNDGKWVENLCNPKFEKEKEYLVELDQPIGTNFEETFSRGMTIGNYTTLPCRCVKISSTSINVTLTEGKNRQIRRMCRALGYRVVKLRRLRVDRFLIDDLAPGELKIIEI